VLWNLINTFIGSLALSIAIWGLLYVRRQFELSKRQDENAKKRASDDEEWSVKFGLAARTLASIGNKLISVPQYGYGYNLVFPSVELRQRIEAHLINLNPTNMSIQVRSLSSDQLRHQDVRRTIADVLAAIEKAKHDIPQAVRVLDIP